MESALDRHRSLLAIAFGIRACLAGHRVRFATATEWVARLAEAKRDGRLEDELAALGRIPLLIVDLGRHRDYADALRKVGVNCLHLGGVHRS